jgi:hypothetical protein
MNISLQHSRLFWDHKTELEEEQGTLLGDHQDDWEDWFEMFLAGYKKGVGDE